MIPIPNLTNSSQAQAYNTGGNPIREGNVYINMSPASLSLGHVVQTLSGPPNTGGADVYPASFYFQTPQSSFASGNIPATALNAPDWKTWLLVGGAAVLGIMVLRKRRR